MFKKKIFNKRVEFTSDDNFDDMLSKSIELYENWNEGQADIVINVLSSKKFNQNILSVNPKLHKSTESGFIQKVGDYEIEWNYIGSTLVINFYYVNPYGLKGVYRKVRGMEFSNHIELFEQVLHELVLVPSLYFQSNCAPIHASSVELDNKIYLFAGTGGVGKSSAMLALRNVPGVKFLADDISVVNNEAVTFPNFAWPKIYAYNCEGTNLEELILNSRSIVNKLHFKLKKRINKTTVRRKISPEKLYKDVSLGGKKVETLYYLFREDVTKVTVQDMSCLDAVTMTKNIMKTEYSYFNSYVYWEGYNRTGLGVKSHLNLDDIFNVWEGIYKRAFSDISVKKISIPLSISHEDYMSQVESWVR